ncbi:unnamed protein product [Didymodactylos carnosus]|uniref:Caspase-8 n=1 Tax=Didymodactylos carnosus TaxID=1234261 RepID=A0A815I0H5_9BILA|nr:unnamed protein product [Didymodactylos carnosus]CAF1358906.1 unnamed protein product [Didymodactylos carnosus]CAF4016267.1 unnamed protein product [Didymodactylos carnosus]CAF4235627.1 unnamed protein product [Didymodactylos carnosus]
MSLDASVLRDCIDALNKWDYDNVREGSMYYSDLIKSQQLLSDRSRIIFETYLQDSQLRPILSPALLRVIILVVCHFKRTYLCQNEDKFFPSYIPQLPSDTHIFNIQQEIKNAYYFLLAAIHIELNSSMVNKIRFYYRMKYDEKATLLTLYETMFAQEPCLTAEQFFRRLEDCYYLKTYLCKIYSIIEGFNHFIKKYQNFLVQYDYERISLSENRVEHVKETSSVKTCTNAPLCGLCVIINISNINSIEYATPIRSGSDKDRQILKSIFSEMNFPTIICKTDCTKDGLERVLDDVRHNSIYSEYDCLVIALMSHGMRNILLTADGEVICIRDLVQSFNDDKKTIWKQKPRLFFVQACRSPAEGTVVIHKTCNIVYDDLSPNVLVAFSCGVEQSSKRAGAIGSIYVQILCIMIYLYGYRYPIHKILDFISSYLRHADKTLKDNAVDQKLWFAQQPQYINRLNENLYLSPHSLVERVRDSKEFNHLELRRPLQGLYHHVKQNLFDEMINCDMMLTTSPDDSRLHCSNDSFLSENSMSF